MMPYMTTYSVTSLDHDPIYDNDGILGLVPNLLKGLGNGLSKIEKRWSLQDLYNTFPDESMTFSVLKVFKGDI